MSIPNHPPQTELNKVLEIISKIEKISAAGNYIFRGEAELYPKVSSNLYRELKKVGVLENLSVETGQQEELKNAKRYGYTKEKDEFEILTDIQHFGGKTNLLDFTTDYRIALFFACDSYPFKDGRIILQDKNGMVKDWIREPRNPDPKSRVGVQKSIFIRPPEGFIEPDEEVIIPKDLKHPMLNYLKKEFNISAETIYPDLHGFVSSQENRWKIYKVIGKGNNCLEQGEDAESSQEKSENYEKAIQHFTSAIDNAIQLDEGFALACKGRGCAYFAKYDLDNSMSDLENAITDFSKALELIPKFTEVYHRRGSAYLSKGDVGNAVPDLKEAIALDPDHAEANHYLGVAYFCQCKFSDAIEKYNRAILLKSDNITYYDRGVAFLHLKKWKEARVDLKHAKNIGVDIIALFHSFYSNIKNCEDKIGTKIPEDIAVMLTQP